MATYYKDIFTKDQCDTINNAMLMKKDQNLLNFEGTEESGSPFYNGSYGISDLSEALELLPVVEEHIMRDYGDEPIIFENTYTRIYPKDSVMKIHTDRPALYLTLTICTFSNLDFDWPIYFSTIPYYEHPNWRGWTSSDSVQDCEHYKSQYLKIITPPGSGGAEKGLIYPHWREHLRCEEGQYVIQTFYHWNFKK